MKLGSWKYGLTPMALASAALLFAACAGEQDSAGPDDPVSTDDRALEVFSKLPKHPSRYSCEHTHTPGSAHCYARVRTDDKGGITSNATPSGFGPADLRSAYLIPASGGAGKTIAIVDAYDNPKAESDLAVYRAQYGLPACTTANGCFKKVNQSGQASPLPAGNTGWGEEIALDLDMASAACPDCKILLVEATSPTTANLGTAVNTAVSLGAAVVSNSYGGSEDSSIVTADTKYFNHPGVGIFVSAGDDGYGVEYPASSQYVTAVGGTSLAKSGTGRGWVETVWNGTGSGCSKYISKPSWQKDTGCTKRTVGDVAAVADPNTGVAVYDTYGTGGTWLVFGGTSVAAPLVSAIYAITGNAAANGSLSYSKTSAFYDVTTGSNGSCSGSYLCTAKAGYDGPTGNGTPNGSLLSGPCTPSCTGKVCGSNGCGGSCGTCAAGQTCNAAGQCVASCTPSCSGKVCGSDGCGGSCGTCAAGKTCNAAGQCVGSSCAHSICTAGVKLTASCDPCATAICSVDSYCCSVKWDSICVGEVGSVCGEGC